MRRVVVSDAVGRRVASGARGSGVYVALGCVRDAGDTVYVLSAAAVTARSAAALSERASGLWALLPSCLAVVALLGAESDARKMTDAAAKLQEAWGAHVCVLCVSKADGTLSARGDEGDAVVHAPLCALFVRTTVLRAELALSADELAGGAALSPALGRLLASCAVLQPSADGGPLAHPGRAVVLRSDDDELKLAVPLRASDSGRANAGDADSFAPVCVRQVSLLQEDYVVRGDAGSGSGISGASSAGAPAAVAGAAVAVELVALVPVDVSGAPAGATTAMVGTSLAELRDGWRVDLEQLLNEREQRLRADAADDETAGDKPVMVASAGAAPTMRRTLLAERGVLFSAIDFDRGIAQGSDDDAQGRLRAEVAVACGESASARSASEQRRTEVSSASDAAAATSGAAATPGGRSAFADGALRLLLVLLISVAVALVAVFVTSWS